MIVLCAKSLAGKELNMERDFLKYYLSRTGQKAVLADEVWEAFRFRVKKASTEEIAEKIITHFRGVFEPENLKLNAEFQEEEPNNHKDEKLYEITKDLVKRKWAEISFMITQEPEKFDGLKVRRFTLEEFYLKCMEEEPLRELIRKFSLKYASEK